MKAGPFLSGLFVGALIGAGITLLLAPASGEEMRQRIQSEVERVRSEVSQAASERRSELEQQLAALRSPKRPAST